MTPKLGYIRATFRGEERGARQAAKSGVVAQGGSRRSGDVHDGMTPTGRGEDLRAPRERGGKNHTEMGRGGRADRNNNKAV